jgi:hypothetical protein
MARRSQFGVTGSRTWDLASLCSSGGYIRAVPLAGVVARRQGKTPRQPVTLSIIGCERHSRLCATGNLDETGLDRGTANQGQLFVGLASLRSMPSGWATPDG